MRKYNLIILVILLLLSRVLISQSNYQDIGNTRLLDSSGVFKITSKPYKSLGSLEIKKDVNFTGAVDLTNVTSLEVSDISVIDGADIDSINADNIKSGTLDTARLPMTVTKQGNTFNGTSQLVQVTASTKYPAIDGSLITNLNATSLASGTMPDARLSSNVVLKDATNVFTGTNTFNSFTQLGESGVAIKNKLIKIAIGSTVQFFTTAHSITNYRNILSADFSIKDDSTGKYLPLGYNASTGMSVKFVFDIDPTNCRYYWDGTAGNLKNDTAYVWITYKE